MVGLHRIYAEPYAGNAASARVLEKAGFTIEAAGQDQLLYAIVDAGSAAR